MISWRSFAAGAFALALTACGTTQEVTQAPTIRPDVVVPSRDLNIVRGALINRITGLGYRVTIDAQSTITFEKKLEQEGFLGGMFGGPPVARVTTVLAESGGAIRIVAELATVNNPGTGNEQRSELRGREPGAVQQALEAVVQDIRSMPPPRRVPAKKKAKKTG
jgi:hypothetical protein